MSLIKVPNTRVKIFSIIFIILILLYYQRLVFIIIYELVKHDKNLIDKQQQYDQIVDNSEMSLGALGALRNPQDKSHQDQDDELNSNSNLSSDKLFEIPKSVFKALSPEVEELTRNYSTLVQNQLRKLNDFDNFDKSVCKRPRLFCGAPNDCGLACQIHKIVTCLMISYSTNRALSIDFNNWPYNEGDLSWFNFFKQIGIGVSSCPLDNDKTAFTIWTRTGIRLSQKDSPSSYPLQKGLVIPKEIGEALKQNDIDPFLWWIGQFVSFAFNLQPWQKTMIKHHKDQMKFSPESPTVGILIRRRDKISERKKTSQSIDKYLTMAKRYFTKYEAQLPFNSSVLRRVYIATDDKNLIKLARKRYRGPRWEMMGLQMKSEAEDIIKDIFILSECDFVLCSFSSEICRLVLELMESKDPNASRRVKSLDHKYFFDIPGNKERKTFALV